jgi:hypothetical protein
MLWMSLLAGLFFGALAIMARRSVMEWLGEIGVSSNEMK